jgi:hypothetical protein
VLSLGFSPGLKRSAMRLNRIASSQLFGRGNCQQHEAVAPFQSGRKIERGHYQFTHQSFELQQL